MSLTPEERKLRDALKKMGFSHRSYSTIEGEVSYDSEDILAVIASLDATREELAKILQRVLERIKFFWLDETAAVCADVVASHLHSPVSGKGRLISGLQLHGADEGKLPIVN